MQNTDGLTLDQKKNIVTKCSFIAAIISAYAIRWLFEQCLHREDKQQNILFKTSWLIVQLTHILVSDMATNNKYHVTFGTTYPITKCTCLRDTMTLNGAQRLFYRNQELLAWHDFNPHRLT